MFFESAQKGSDNMAIRIKQAVKLNICMLFLAFVLAGCADVSTKPISDNSAAITEAGSETDSVQETDSTQALATVTDAEGSTCPQSVAVYTFDLSPDSVFQGDKAFGNMGDYNIRFKADVDFFDGLQIGKGIEGEYWGWNMRISDGSVQIVDAQTQEELDTFPFNLEVKDYVAVQIAVDLQGKALVQISTNGGYIEREVPCENGNGTLYVNAVGQTSLSDCRLSYECNGWNKGIWLYGDSYFSMTADDRWTSYLLKNGSSNIMLNAYSGKTSEVALQSLQNDLQYGTPEKVIWCMGMNDGDVDGQINESWLACLKQVEDLCKERDIELILATIPTCPYWNNDAKNPYVQSSGYRYIDFAGAVGAYDSKTWYEGMLEETEPRIHPTTEGARALYYEAVATVPELGR